MRARQDHAAHLVSWTAAHLGVACRHERRAASRRRKEPRATPTRAWSRSIMAISRRATSPMPSARARRGSVLSPIQRLLLIRCGGDVMSSNEVIGVAEAHELVCREIFGDDWIEELTASEDKLIRDYGPKIEPLIPAQAFRIGSVGPCPSASRERLDRAIGRYLRMNAQRIAAAEWLMRSGPAAHFGTYDRVALLAAVKNIGRQPSSAIPGRGRRPDLGERVERDIRAQLRSGDLTLDKLTAMKLKTLGKKFECGKNTASKIKKRIIEQLNSGN